MVADIDLPVQDYYLYNETFLFHVLVNLCLNLLWVFNMQRFYICRIMVLLVIIASFVSNICQGSAD